MKIRKVTFLSKRQTASLYTLFSESLYNCPLEKTIITKSLKNPGPRVENHPSAGLWVPPVSGWEPPGASGVRHPSEDVNGHFNGMLEKTRQVWLLWN